MNPKILKINFKKLFRNLIFMLMMTKSLEYLTKNLILENLFKVIKIYILLKPKNEGKRIKMP